MDDDDILDEAREFLKISDGDERDNRERGQFSLEFAQGGDAQWDGVVLATRRMPGNAQPSESYNQMPNFINQVVNDGRMNMSQTKFIANDDSDEETAEKMEDKARDIQTKSEAETAYDTALYGQCVPGWGYWRYETAYESDDSDDLEIRIKTIENQFTVYDDPFISAITQLERRMLLETSYMPRKEFNAQYDEDYGDFELNSIGDNYPGWAGKDGIRVAEFWKRTEEKTKRWRNKETGKSTEEKPDDLEGWDEREVSNYKVMWYLIVADKILKRQEWLGKYIPYVKVVGQEININGKKRISGMVERLIPAQKQMNYFTNAAVEAMALAPKSPWIADPRGIAPYQDVWDNANIINYPYLPYKMSDEQGPIAPPTRNDTGTNLNGFVTMAQQAQQNFYNLSGIFPASLGQSSNEKSGKAILARQKEGDVSTFHIHDNMSRGQRIGGVILADLMPKVYDGSRVVKGKRPDGSYYRMKINQKYKENGRTKEYDFTKGKFDVVVTTGPSYTTKRAEAADSQIQLAQAYPQIMQIAGSDIVRNFDWPGAQEISEKLKILEQSQFPMLSELDNKDEIPPALAAQIQALQQQLQQAAQQVQAQQASLQSKQAEDQSKIADSETKRLQLQLTAKKNDQDFQIRQAELVIQAQQGNEQEKTVEQPQPQMPDDENVLVAQIQAIQQKKQREAMMADQQAQQANATLQNNMQFQGALLQGIQGVQDMLAANAQATAAQTQATQTQTSAILAPIRLMRDPQTNMATGALKVIN